MENNILNIKFYKQHTLEVAKQLLGKFLCCKTNNNIYKLLITETECYHGPKDKAAHTYKGRTERNSPMFDTVGHTYIYLTYGIYWMLNITTYKENFPSAVLIRGGWDDKNQIWLNGPGKLTKYIEINKSLNKLPVYDKSSGIWIEENTSENLYCFNNQIKTSKRVGVDYAQECKDWMWNFSLVKK